MISQIICKYLDKKIKFFIISLYIIGATQSLFSVQNKQNETPNKIEKPKESKSAVYGYFYNKVAQNKIDYNGIITVPTMDPISTKGFLNSCNNAVIVPETGVYLIGYRIVASEVMTTGLAQNGKLLPNTTYVSFSNSGTPVGLYTQVIVPLNAFDEISVINLNQFGKMPSTLSVLTNNPSNIGFPVEMTLILLK